MLTSSKSKSKDNASLNIFGRKLSPCCKDPMTGFYRDGSCRSNKQDQGNHSVCAILSQEFLEFTKSRGNDLSTPNRKYGFPGLKKGDKWCLCANRWLEAKNNGIVLKVDLEATSIRSLEVTSDFDFKWTNRVLRCALNIYSKQFEELQKDAELAQTLKLIAVPDKNISQGCHIVGLDGTIKHRSSDGFKLDELTSLINSMPMRQREMQDKKRP